MTPKCQVFNAPSFGCEQEVEETTLEQQKHTKCRATNRLALINLVAQTYCFFQIISALLPLLFSRFTRPRIPVWWIECCLIAATHASSHGILEKLLKMKFAP